jgi:hypothetical protein
MDHERFVEVLNQGVTDGIVAFDQADEECILHLREGKVRAVISRGVMARQSPEVFSALRQRIRGADWPSRLVRIDIKNGKLRVSNA